MFITITIYKCYVICCLRDFCQSVYNLEENMPMKIKFKLQMDTKRLTIPKKMKKIRSRKLKNERQYNVPPPPKEDQPWSPIHLAKNQRLRNTKSCKSRKIPECCERVGRSCSTKDTRRVMLVTNDVINHDR